MSFRNLSNAVYTRELRRILVTTPKDKDSEEEITIDDYWKISETDDKNNIIYEKRFELDDYPEAVNHFEERSGYPVTWQVDEEPKELFNWIKNLKR